MAVRSLPAVLAGIAESDPVNGIRLVGIDGPAGSGKTTLARRLGQLAGAPVIELDDFMSWRDLDEWWPRLETEVLGPLIAGRDADFGARDWADDPLGVTVGERKTVRWAPLVILEGVTSTRSEVSTRLAYRIWVEAPEELRLARGLQRDGQAQHELWKNWMRLEAEFFAEDRTRDRADLIVDGAPEIPYDPENELVLRD